MRKQTRQRDQAPSIAGGLGYLARRLREPSTYAGLALLAPIVGLKPLAALSNPEIAGALAAIAAILLPDGV